MNSYICVTYAQDDREINDRFCRSLSRYGFRFQCVNELSDPAKRGPQLTEAALLIALTSPAAEQAETVGGDIRRALERGMAVLCVSLADNELDSRFCAGQRGGATLIPYPVGETPDRHSVALFVHRLFVRHLTRLQDCFVESRCAEDVYGTIIRTACHAHSGDGAACHALGCAYREGEALPALENEAAYWLGLAAGQNIPDALIQMGLLCLSGKGTLRDPEAAFALFSRAAELGECRGDYHQGLCYLEGLGVIKDPFHAVVWIKRAADRGYAPALYRMGCLSRDGIGTPRNIPAARNYFYKACRQSLTHRVEPHGAGVDFLPGVYARHGHPTCVAMRHYRHSTLEKLLGDRALRTSHKEGAGALSSAACCMGRARYRVVSLPEERWELPLAERWRADTFQPTSESRRELARMAYDLGRLLAEGDPAGNMRPALTSALRWYRYAALLGHAEALYALGDAYRRGLGTPVSLPHAASLYRLAADNGSVRGQFAYAVCCERGIGTEENFFRAADYYERAACADYAPAQNNLGGCYEAGRGVVQNQLMAVEWYSRAAALGLTESMCRLGICYELGRGVTADIQNAIRLYESAAARGHAHAQYRLGLYYHARAHRQDELLKKKQAEDTAVRVASEESLESGGTAAGQTRGVTDSPTAGGTVSAASSLAASSLAASPEGTASELTREELDGVTDRLQALELYRRAAEGGSPDAAYALYLCHSKGYGVAPDGEAEIANLRRAAEGGCLQAMYELGLCYLEGRGMPRDPAAAVAWFGKAVKLWRARREDAQWIHRDGDRGTLPPGSMPTRRAMGGVLYMLGYCALYGIGRTTVLTPIDLSVPPAPQRVEEAVPYFTEAAENNHVGALTMLGDLYAFGLLKNPMSTPEDESLRYYLEGWRVFSEGTDPDMATGDRTDSTVDALMSLAERALNAAALAEDEGDAELALVNAVRSLSECERLGSADALVRMAVCMFGGKGTPCDRSGAIRALYRATGMDGGRVEASLWLGDILRSQWGGSPDPDGADMTYRRGLESRSVESECGPYTLGLRRTRRKEADEAVRTEVYYRLATLRAAYFSDEADRRISFPYLAEAVLRGHQAALDDLARIYAYETTDPRAARAPEEEGKKKGFISPLGPGASLRRKMRRGVEDPTKADRAAHMHQTWMTDYFTALWPEPQPFSYEMRSLAVSRDVPEYVTAPVTDLMRLDALCYLGECFFEGHGLPVRPEAAVTCFKAAVALKIPVERGKPLPVSQVNAIYSLGWCTLYGVGTKPDPVQAVRQLTQVAKVHGGAAYTLGICHEEGRGVVIPDAREALKHYRKALNLGYTKAAEKVAALEKRLRDQA